MKNLIFFLLIFCLSVPALAQPFRYTVKNKKTGQITNQWESDQLPKDYWEPSMGKPDRWLQAEEARDEKLDLSSAISTRKVIVRGQEVTLYRFPAEYEVLEENIKGERDLQEAKRQADNARKEKIKKATDIDKMTLPQLADLVKAMRDELIANGYLEPIPERDATLDRVKFKVKSAN